MPQFVYFLDLVDDPALIAEYDDWHTRVWPEVLDHLRNIGFQSCTIYRAGNRLAMIVESDEAVPSNSAPTPKVQEWEQMMDRFQIPLAIAKAGEKWVQAQPVFTL